MKQSIAASSCTMITQSPSGSDRETARQQPCWEKYHGSGHHQDQQAAEPRRKQKELTGRQSGNDDVSQNQTLTRENVMRTKDDVAVAGHQVSTEDTGRERLKRHRDEVAGQVWIPDIWGQEDLLKDWIDCSAFDASVMNTSIMSARAALVAEGRRAHSTRLRIENSY